MTTILVGECKQEVSSFNPVASRFNDFDISIGEEIPAFHRGLNTEMAGALGVFATRAGAHLRRHANRRGLAAVGAGVHRVRAGRAGRVGAD
jgi:hypothetical protein